MAQATNYPIKSGGSVTVIVDDTEGTPIALQISHDLAALSVRLTQNEARAIIDELQYCWEVGALQWGDKTVG